MKARLRQAELDGGAKPFPLRGKAARHAKHASPMGAPYASPIGEAR
jgi:hypothetical protein